MYTKIYLVEFIEYTNPMRDTVSNPNMEIGKGRYININKEGFLVREEHLEFIKKWGKGIKSIKLVGELFEIPFEMTAASNYKGDDY